MWYQPVKVWTGYLDSHLTARGKGGDAARLIPPILTDLKLSELKAENGSARRYLRLCPSPISTSFCHTASAASEQGVLQPKIAAQARAFTDRFCVHRNLMAPDSFKNLGFGDDSDSPGLGPATATSSQPSQPLQGHDKPHGA